jgi:hypothetical protein
MGNMEYLRRILLAQAVDHAFALVWVVALSTLALALSPSPLAQTLGSVGPALWLASAGIFLVTGALFRLLSIRYLGATPGQMLTGLRVKDRPTSPAFARGLVLESLQPALPLLWMADFALRRADARAPATLGWNYGFAFEELA